MSRVLAVIVLLGAGACCYKRVEPCSPRAQACSADSAAIRECDADGRGWSELPCAVGTTCRYVSQVSDAGVTFTAPLCRAP